MKLNKFAVIAALFIFAPISVNAQTGVNSDIKQKITKKIETYKQKQREKDLSKIENVSKEQYKQIIREEMKPLLPDIAPYSPEKLCDAIYESATVRWHNGQEGGVSRYNITKIKFYPKVSVRTKNENKPYPEETSATFQDAVVVLLSSFEQDEGTDVYWRSVRVFQKDGELVFSKNGQTDIVVANLSPLHPEDVIHVRW